MALKLRLEARVAPNFLSRERLRVEQYFIAGGIQTHGLGLLDLLYRLGQLFSPLEQFVQPRLHI